MDPVVHFEMPFEDRKRMVDFYGQAFGWKATLYGPEMGDYAVMQTSECDVTGMPLKPAMINGGFYKKPEDPHGQYPSVVIAVEDINAALKKVEEAGGKVSGEPMEIPNVGIYGVFFDTEGNRVSLMQPFMKM